MSRSEKTTDEKRSAAVSTEPDQYLDGRIFSPPDQTKCLDSLQLARLEESFREWLKTANRKNVRESRQRIFFIFLVIRYTGAKLSEVLNLDARRDFDFENGSVTLGRLKGDGSGSGRLVQISEKLCHEISTCITDASTENEENMFRVDPGFVRRKFYERAEACDIPKQLGAPEVLRKSRAVELMQNNLPLPAVQMLLGHSTPSLTSAYVSFSDNDIRQVTRMILDKESARRTSARNSFFGKISEVRQGDIQSRVEITTIGGYRITTMITNGSMHRLGLKEGKMITAEVKAPWVMLDAGPDPGKCSADNILKGIVEKISIGKLTAEYLVRISDGTAVCSIVSAESARRLALSEGDEACVLFSCYAVILLS